MNENKFSAPQDTVVKIITNAAIIICLLLFYNLIRNGSNSALSVFSILLLIIIIAWCFHPQYYELTDLGLKIKWPVGQLLISYKSIKNAGSLTRDDIRYSWRLFACGGLFGYFGWYFSKSIGRFYMFCANKDQMVAIMSDGARIVIISPDNSDAFLEKLNARLS